MAKSIETELSALIGRLQRERQEHADAIAEIDGIFERYGIKTSAAAPAPRRGRPASKPATPAAPERKRGRAGRGSFATSGTSSVLDFIRKGGAKGVTSSAIASHWKSQGRAGQPYITLGQLVKRKKIRRENLKGQRGSQYFIVGS